MPGASLATSPQCRRPAIRRFRWAAVGLLSLLGAALLGAALLATTWQSVGPSAVARRATGPATGRAAPGPGASPVGVTAADRAPGWALSTGADGGISDGEVARLLATRSTALLRRDRAGWLGSVLPGPSGAGQAALFDRLAAVPLVRWSYRLLGAGPDLAPARRAELGGRARVVHVVLSYRLRGDTRDTVRDRYLAIVATSGHLVTADGDAPADPDLWDLGPVQVVRTAHTLVIGAVVTGRAAGRAAGQGAAPDLPALAAQADAAGAGVDGLWGPGRPRQAVLLVPADLDQLARLLGVEGTAGLAQLAAVTSGELDRSAGPAAGAGVADRVLLDPVAFGRLSALGRQVVLTHELTHLATRATARLTVPTWLEEGLADYVGYRGSGLGPAVVAADELSAVRAGGPPPTLPGAADFDPDRGDVARAYGGAWLACDLIAGGDPRRLVTFYRIAAGIDPGSGQPAATPDDALARAFAVVPGTDAAGFTARWRARLVALAGSGG